MEQAEEIKQMIQSASNGYWLPIAIVTTSFSIIIGLLLYIWNQMLKQNEKRHSEHEVHNSKQDKILERVSESVDSLRIIVTEIQTKQDFTINKMRS